MTSWADHELAFGLWASGNHDARVLATMIADPARMDAWRAAKGKSTRREAAGRKASASRRTGD